MWAKIASRQNPLYKFYSTPANSMKVAIMGATGNVGKSVALMLKQSSYIDELALYDTKPNTAFVDDLNYIDTRCRVTAYNGSKEIKDALHHSNVVLVLSPTSQSETVTYQKLLEKNAPLIKEAGVNISRHAQKALVAIGAEPINSTVPMFSEIVKKQGHYNPNAIFGVTTIDVVRTNKFVAEIQGLEPECVVVPLIGGHTDKTIVPVLSKATPCSEFTNEELEDITKSVRQANDNLLKVRSCGDGAYLSNAFATARFVVSLVKGLRGQGNVVECAYVKSKSHPQLKYMVTPVLLGPVGLQKNLGVPELSDYETCLFENAVPTLVADIKKGEVMGGREDKPNCDVCDPNVRAPPCPPDHCELRTIMGEK